MNQWEKDLVALEKIVALLKSKFQSILGWIKAIYQDARKMKDNLAWMYWKKLLASLDALLIIL